jgi:hypothetical protein
LFLVSSMLAGVIAPSWNYRGEFANILADADAAEV